MGRCHDTPLFKPPLRQFADNAFTKQLHSIELLTGNNSNISAMKLHAATIMKMYPIIRPHNKSSAAPCKNCVACLRLAGIQNLFLSFIIHFFCFQIIEKSFAKARIANEKEKNIKLT